MSEEPESISVTPMHPREVASVPTVFTDPVPKHDYSVAHILSTGIAREELTPTELAAVDADAEFGEIGTRVRQRMIAIRDELAFLSELEGFLHAPQPDDQITDVGSRHPSPRRREEIKATLRLLDRALQGRGGLAGMQSAGLLRPFPDAKMLYDGDGPDERHEGKAE